MTESTESLCSKFDALREEFTDLNNKVVGSDPVIQKVLETWTSWQPWRHDN
jgi:hypothetical protein